MLPLGCLNLRRRRSTIIMYASSAHGLTALRENWRLCAKSVSSSTSPLSCLRSTRVSRPLYLSWFFVNYIGCFVSCWWFVCRCNFRRRDQIVWAGSWPSSRVLFGATGRFIEARGVEDIVGREGGAWQESERSESVQQSRWKSSEGTKR